MKSMIRTLTTIDQVLAALGGLTKFARRHGYKGPQAISNQRARGKLAPKTYLVSIEDLKKIKCRADPALWGMQAGNGGLASRAQRVRPQGGNGGGPALKRRRA